MHANIEYRWDLCLTNKGSVDDFCSLSRQTNKHRKSNTNKIQNKQNPQIQTNEQIKFQKSTNPQNNNFGHLNMSSEERLKVKFSKCIFGLFRNFVWFGFYICGTFDVCVLGFCSFEVFGCLPQKNSVRPHAKLNRRTARGRRTVAANMSICIVDSDIGSVRSTEPWALAQHTRRLSPGPGPWPWVH